MPSSSWLFIRDGESIWIERPYGFSIRVAGPGAARAHLDFPNEQAVQEYQVATAERLTGSGWFLWGFDKERRTRGERRKGLRTVADRRQPLVDPHGS
jgi:hypothetical protein